MWCDMAAVRAVPLPCGPGMVPEPEAARALITARTRAIVLVSPNNPTGAEYPAETLAAFAELARSHGLALIVDETYRDFDARSGRPHDLFTDPDWRDVLIHLYSFSKAYRLTGHRVGAIIAGPDRLAQIEKFLDTVAICASQLGQIAAHWGLCNLAQWVAGERAEILSRRAAITADAPTAPGWQVLGAGAYFAWVQHPFDLPSDQLARAMLAQAGILALPGTMFTPPGDPAGLSALRIAFANIDAVQIAELFARLARLDLPRRI
jgi:aspartate/methionine/tyrosine aminotransferase